MKTLYAVLGVDPGVGATELEDAFLRLKVRYPQGKLDSDENARIQFQGINQAYNVLSNPDSRKLYDRRLANAGVRTVTVTRDEFDEPSGWLSTRNLIVAGIIALLISGMWFYHAREKARMEQEIIERALRLAEEEKKREAEMRQAEETRRQQQFSANQERQAEMRERQLRNEAAQSGRESSYQSANLQRQQAAEARQAEYDKQRRESQEQMTKARAAQEAERRLYNEKQQLRSICMQRYNRPDC
jgi:curved DNA-binding protein CbpA